MQLSKRFLRSLSPTRVGGPKRARREKLALLLECQSVTNPLGIAVLHGVYTVVAAF